MFRLGLTPPVPPRKGEWQWNGTPVEGGFPFFQSAGAASRPRRWERDRTSPRSSQMEVIVQDLLKGRHPRLTRISHRLS